MRDESGKITLGFVIFAALCAIALDAAFQMVPIYMNYLNFKNEVESRAMETRIRTTEVFRADLIKKAAEYSIFLDDEHLLVDFENHSTHIKASWSVEANFLGGYYKKTLSFTSETTRPNLRS